MINRVLIRIRVVQIVFACYESEVKDLRKAENDLLFSLQKSYDLYFYLLLLMADITQLYEQRVNARKSKYIQTLEDTNPDTRLIKNRFIAQLNENKIFDKYLSNRPYSWSDHESFLRTLLDTILKSDIYKDYINNPSDSYDIDREFWRQTFKNIILQTEGLYDLLEDESLFWNDDIDIIASFVVKTIKRFDPKNGNDQELLPMFRDASDKEFAIKLLHQTMLGMKEYRGLVDKYTQNWESERIAMMDMVIMLIAITEIINFESIPTNVTLNEYINIAKAYSTNKSASFINGILDTIVKDLKADNKIFKN